MYCGTYISNFKGGGYIIVLVRFSYHFKLHQYNCNWGLHINYNTQPKKNHQKMKVEKKLEGILLY